MATYTITISKTAQKELATLPKHVQQRIVDAIYKLQDAPLPTGVKKLKGKEAQYRIRVGDYRIIYTIDGGALTILVLKIAQRQEAYE